MKPKDRVALEMPGETYEGTVVAVDEKTGLVSIELDHGSDSVLQYPPERLKLL